MSKLISYYNSQQLQNGEPCGMCKSHGQILLWVLQYFPPIFIPSKLCN